MLLNNIKIIYHCRYFILNVTQDYISFLMNQANLNLKQ